MSATLTANVLSSFLASGDRRLCQKANFSQYDHTVMKNLLSSLLVLFLAATTTAAAADDEEIECRDHQEEAVLDVLLDEHPEQQGWTLTCDGAVLWQVDVGTLTPSGDRAETWITETACVSEGQRCDFTLLDAAGDGLTGEGFYALRWGSVTVAVSQYGSDQPFSIVTSCFGSSERCRDEEPPLELQDEDVLLDDDEEEDGGGEVTDSKQPVNTSSKKDDKNLAAILGGILGGLVGLLCLLVLLVAGTKRRSERRAPSVKLEDDGEDEETESDYGEQTAKTAATKNNNKNAQHDLELDEVDLEAVPTARTAVEEEATD